MHFVVHVGIHIFPHHVVAYMCVCTPSFCIIMSEKCKLGCLAKMSLCRNLEYHSRPDFATIVDLLVVPDSLALLDIPRESLSHVASPHLAAQLGAPMSSARDLYMNLQRKYSQ